MSCEYFMVRRILGPPAIGDSFFDRKEITENIVDRLKTTSILLVAPRRFGKTSIMLNVKDVLEKQKIGPILYLDVEWIADPSDFITEVLSKLIENEKKSPGAWIKNLPTNIIDLTKNLETIEVPYLRMELRKEFKDTWMEKGHEVLKKLQDSGASMVLIVDEFPLMIHNMIERKKLDPEEIRNFLSWIRSIRIELNVKMVFGGSIGIDFILKKLNASASINDFERIVVGPFANGIASNFISLLFESEEIKISTKNVYAILEKLGVPIPYFVQIMVSALLAEVKESKQEISTDLIDKVYHERVLGIECKSYFEHYFQRLSIYYSEDDSKICKKLLTNLAKQENMTKQSLYNLFSMDNATDDIERFNFLLGELENDFYIYYDCNRKRYFFGTKVLRDLWLRRYEAFE